MILIPAVGCRTVFTHDEVAKWFGMTLGQVRYLASSGRLRKRGEGQYPFFQTDVNQFLVRLNAGEVCIRRGHKVNKASTDRVLKACEAIEGTAK